MSEHARLDLLLDGLLHPGEVDRLVAGARTTSPEELRWLSVRVVAHLDQIEATAHDRAQVDVDTARQVAASLIALIDGGGAALDADGRALVHGAVEYFVLDRDSSSDTDDGLGFDDDARVLNAVLTAVGRADLRVQPA
jgi:uncharacterized membrane protein YkvA (DUF1232 family)